MHEEAVLASIEAGIAPELSCQKAVQEFLLDERNRVAHGTHGNYRHHLNRWLLWTVESEQVALSQARHNWPEFWSWFCRSHRGEAWHKAAAIQKTFWNWAVDTKRCPESPVQTGPLPRRITHHRLPPHEGDFARLMARAVPETIADICLQAMLEVIAGSGCRSGEVISMTTTRTDTEQRTAQVRLKGGGTGGIYLTAEACTALDRWQAVRRQRNHQGRETLFLTRWGNPWCPEELSMAVRMRNRKRGISPSIVAHQLRHRFAQRCLDSGATLPEVQALLNHSSLLSTLPYLHATASATREAHERANRREEVRHAATPRAAAPVVPPTTTNQARPRQARRGGWVTDRAESATQKKEEPAGAAQERGTNWEEWL